MANALAPHRTIAPKLLDSPSTRAYTVHKNSNAGGHDQVVGKRVLLSGQLSARSRLDRRTLCRPARRAGTRVPGRLPCPAACGARAVRAHGHAKRHAVSRQQTALRRNRLPGRSCWPPAGHRLDRSRSRTLARRAVRPALQARGCPGLPAPAPEKRAQGRPARNLARRLRRSPPLLGLVRRLSGRRLAHPRQAAVRPSAPGLLWQPAPGLDRLRAVRPGPVPLRAGRYLARLARFPPARRHRPLHPAARMPRALRCR